MTQAAKAAGAPARPYADTCEHLADELKKLDCLLQWRIAEFRQRTQTFPATGQQQIYIAHGEVDALLQQTTASVPDAPEITAFRSRLAQQRQTVDSRALANVEEGCELPLARLGRIFDLSRFEQDVLLICLAPELDRKYDRLYAYLQDDITRKKPSVDLALQLLFDTPAERWQARACFADSSPLFRFDLLQVSDDPPPPPPPRKAPPDQAISRDFSSSIHASPASCWATRAAARGWPALPIWNGRPQQQNPP
jgi:hypothetical protein